MRNENMIAALKRERAGYVARGLDDRVGQVDEQLRHYGYDPEAPSPGGGPQGRSGRESQQQTADTGTQQQTGDAGAKAPVKKAAAKKTTPPPQK